MKEATSSLNTTVVSVLAVGVLIAFFYYTIWPIVKRNFEENSQCSQAICDKCKPDANGKKNCEYVNCHLKGDDDPANTFQCVWKG